MEGERCLKCGERCGGIRDLGESMLGAEGDPPKYQNSDVDDGGYGDRGRGSKKGTVSGKIFSGPNERKKI